MRKDLTHNVYSCTSYQDYARSPWRPPPTDIPIPLSPWRTVAADVFNLRGNSPDSRLLQ